MSCAGLLKHIVAELMLDQLYEGERQDTPRMFSDEIGQAETQAVHDDAARQARAERVGKGLCP